MKDLDSLNSAGPEAAGLPSRSAPNGSWLEGGRAWCDPSGRITSANRNLADWLGATPAQLCGADLLELLSRKLADSQPSPRDLWVQTIPWSRAQLSAGTEPRAWFQFEIARSEAAWLVSLDSLVPPLRQMLEEGTAPGPREDSEKQQLRLRLMRAEARLEKLIQRWPGVLFTQRADFSFEYVNGTIEELTGIPPENWRKQPRTFWEVVHEADVDELRRQCREALRNPAGVTTTYRVRHVRTGKVSYILEHRQASVSRSGLALGYEGFWLDVTRQTIAEKRLSTAAWKETLAQLTMGLAHDFSNLMSGILSLSELILSQVGPEHPSVSTLEMIKQSALQASQLVQRIVNLHRSKKGMHEYLDLNQVVSELVDLVCKVLPRRIQVKTELAPAQLPVYMDAVEFRQVVLNLALNAADAMPNRGVLSFRVSAHTERQELKNFQGGFPRVPCACLSVQDNGCGIADRHLPHVFDPFFTTKPLTKGSGLGLYNARMFVEEHGGAISVESQEGVGTTFRLWLPQADFTEAERKAAENAERRRCLLLVGQPGLATDTTSEFLRTNNYYVVVTNTPARAVELLASEENNLHGVLVLAEPQDHALLGLLAELHDRRLARRLVLQIIGGTTDQVDQACLEKAGLVLPSNSDETTMLQKLNSLLAEPAP